MYNCLRSSSLYQDASSRPLPTADSSFTLYFHYYRKEQGDVRRVQHNRLIAARHWNALRPPDAPDTDPEVVGAAERRLPATDGTMKRMPLIFNATQPEEPRVAP
jgi:hypothetical protein